MPTSHTGPPSRRRAAPAPAPAAASDPDFMLSLARGLAAMRALAAHGPRLTAAEVAHLTHMSRGAAGRCLHTLRTLGYATNTGSGFELTPAVLSLASGFLASSRDLLGSASLARVAQPILERVSQQLHESCSLAVLDDREIVYIGRAAARRILSVELSVGSRLPAACTSMGRVLVACLDADQQARALARLKLERHTRFTIVDKVALAEELAQVRAQDYAIVDQELEVGLRSIAVPIRREDGTVVAAINAGVHAARADKATLRREFLPVLQLAARDITTTLRGQA